MSSLNRPIFLSFSNRYISLILDLGLVVLISRILSPEELGLYSLAVGSLAIGQMLREFGLTLYIVKEKDLSIDKIQGCFTISIMLCWLLGVIYLLSAGAIGNFYDSEQVVLLVQILSINFFLLPFSTLIISLFTRNLQFGLNMLIMVVGTLVRVVSTLILLYFDTSLESLAWGGIIGTASNLLFAIYFGEWKYYRLNFRYIKEIAKFTSFVSSANIMGQLGTIFPEVMIGKFLTTEKVAFFGKGVATINLFSMLILSVIGSVISPVISRLNHQNENLSESIYSIYDYVLVFQWPFYVSLILFAEDFIAILYGSQWGEVVILTQIMAFFMLFEGLIALAEKLLNTLGDVKFSFKVTFIITSLKFISVVVFIDHGLVAIAFAISSLTILKVLLILPRVIKIFKLSMKGLIKVYSKNAAISICILFVGYSSQLIFQDMSLFVRSTANGIVLLVGWVGLVFLFSHPIKNKIIYTLNYITLRFS